MIYQLNTPYSKRKQDVIESCLKAWGYEYTIKDKKIMVENYFKDGTIMTIDLNIIHLNAFNDSFKTWV